MAVAIENTTNLFTNPSFEAASGTVEVRRNRELNPSATVDTSNWTAGTEATFTRDTAVYHSSPASFKVVCPSSLTASNGSMTTGVVNRVATPGVVNTFSAWVLGEAGKSIDLVLRSIDAAGTSLITNVYVAEMTGGWQRVSASFTFGATATQALLAVRNASVLTAHTFYVDDILFEASPTVNTYFDGSVPPKVRRNYINNPDFVTGTAGWAGYGSDVTVGTSATAYSGTQSLSVAATTSGTKGVQTTSAAKVVTGVVYTASAYCYAVSGTAQTRVRISWYNGTTFVSASEGTLVTPTVGEWVRLSVTGTAPATATRADVIVYMPSSVGGTDSRLVDAVLMEESATVDPYFDGTTPPKVRRNIHRNPRSLGTLDDRNRPSPLSAPNVATPNISYDGRTDWLQLEALAGTGVLHSDIFRTNMSLGTLENGAYYTVSMLVANPGTKTITFTLDWCDSVVGVTNVTLLPGETKRISTTGIAPAGGVYTSTYRFFDLANFLEDGLPAGTILVTDMLVEKGTDVLDFFDGSTSPDPTLAPAWEGTANLSASYLYSRATAPAWEGTANASASYLYDPDFTPSWTGTANSSASVLTGLGVADIDTVGRPVIQSSHWFGSGSKSMRLINVPGSGTYQYNLDRLDTAPFNLAPGDTYTLLVKVRSDAPIAFSSASFYIRYNGSATITSPQTSLLGLDGELSIVFTDTIPLDITSSSQFRLTLDSVDGDLWVDNWLVVEGDYKGDYFDGSTADSTTIGGAAWTGAADASTSTAYALNILPPYITRWDGTTETLVADIEQVT